MSERHECTGPDPDHDWSGPTEDWEGGRLGYTCQGRTCRGYICSRCGLEIPASIEPVTLDDGTVLRDPLTGAPIATVQTAGDAFSDYKTAMNGGWDGLAPAS